MTDADVDGSHIRTLLLTFFFNELLELVQKGHVYIAQPPLYKVKRGKKEEYVNSDEELNNLIINNAITGLKLTQPGKKKGLEGDGLYNILMQQIETSTLIDKLAVQIGDTAARTLSQYKVISKTDANNNKKLELWVKGFSRAAKKLAKEKDDLEQELLEIELEQRLWEKQERERNGADRVREIEHWSRIKKELDDGSFDTKDVNIHQKETLKLQLQERAKNLTPGSSQGEMINVLGPLKTIDEDFKKQIEAQEKAMLNGKNNS